MTNKAPSEWIESIIAALDGHGRRPLIEFIQGQRWFGGKGKSLADVHLLDVVRLPSGTAPVALAVLRVAYRGGETERYVIPLTIRPRCGPEDRAGLVELPGSPAHEWVCDATGDQDTWRRLYDSVAQGKELAGRSGSLMGLALPQGRDLLSAPVQDITILSAEQSNTTVVFDRRVILKLFRKPASGINPDSEMLEFLTARTECRDVPALLGVMTYDDGVAETEPATVVMIQQFVPNCGDGWRYTLAHLHALLDEGAKAVPSRSGSVSKVLAEISGPFLGELRQLGMITGSLHVALASRPESEAFRPEPITLRDIENWQSGMRKHLTEVCFDLRALPPERHAILGMTGNDVTGLETACLDRFGDLQLLSRSGTSKIRHHGDFHLGQVLKTPDGFVIIDFEGEPARPIEERRAKVCPLKDVAGMVRSFNYAAHAALKQRATVSTDAAGLMKEWERAARVAFFDGYRTAAEPGRAIFMPATWDEAVRIIQVYELDKALYELRYEMRNRPEWLSIPLQGIRDTLQRAQG